MSTGGIALLLSVTPHLFKGLTTVGTIIFNFDLLLLTASCIAISIRFYLYPSALFRSLHHPTESLSFSTMWLSIVTIICGIQKYGAPSSGHWIIAALRILFWTYAALTFLNAVFQYYLLFTGKPLTLQSMTPAWILPIFPVML
ncbi:MAG: hypothetical protein M1827_007326 [Pycnora praestabilis]|nr:MAG: hypothetical protein M1827_007326 [Pycnora praestabilis]